MARKKDVALKNRDTRKRRRAGPRAQQFSGPVALFFISGGTFFAAPPPSSPLADRVRMLITVILLGASLFIILSSRYTPTDRHWAYATVAAILGFCLPK